MVLNQPYEPSLTQSGILGRGSITLALAAPWVSSPRGGTWRRVPMSTASLAETGAFLVSSGNRQTFAPRRGTVTQPMAVKLLNSRSCCSCVNY